MTHADWGGVMRLPRTVLRTGIQSYQNSSNLGTPTRDQHNWVTSTRGVTPCKSWTPKLTQLVAAAILLQANHYPEYTSCTAAAATSCLRFSRRRRHRHRCSRPWPSPCARRGPWRGWCSTGSATTCPRLWPPPPCQTRLASSGRHARRAPKCRRCVGTQPRHVLALASFQA